MIAYQTALVEIGNAFSSDEELTDGIKGTFTFLTEVEILVSEDIDDVVHDRLVHILCSASEHFIDHRARNFCHGETQRRDSNFYKTDLITLLHIQNEGEGEHF